MDWEVGTHCSIDYFDKQSFDQHMRISLAAHLHRFRCIAKTHSFVAAAMAGLREVKFFIYPKHAGKMAGHGKAVARSPARDAANFSYLVEDGTLEPGDEYEVVTKLAADAWHFIEEVTTYPYLKNTKGSAGHDLFRLLIAIAYFKQEMDKIERELTTLDFDPKEYGILEVVVCYNLPHSSGVD